MSIVAEDRSETTSAKEQVEAKKPKLQEAEAPQARKGKKLQNTKAKKAYECWMCDPQPHKSHLNKVGFTWAKNGNNVVMYKK